MLNFVRPCLKVSASRHKIGKRLGLVEQDSLVGHFF